MSTIEVHKGKLLKGDKINIAYTERWEGKKPRSHDIEQSEPPHDDLRNAFLALRIHAALLSELISAKSVKDINNPDSEVLTKFNVSGFTITGDEDNQGVILTAQKTLKTGKQLVFNTPNTLFEELGDDPYPFMDHFFECVKKCKNEVAEYLNCKFAPVPSAEPDPQLSLELEK